MLERSPTNYVLCLFWLRITDGKDYPPMLVGFGRTADVGDSRAALRFFLFQLNFTRK